MKRCGLIALLLLALALTGCMPMSSRLYTVDASEDLPTAPPQDIAPAVGDVISSREVNVVLRFPAADQQELVGVEKTLTVEAGQTLSYRLAQALLEGPGETDARPAAPEGVTLESVRVSDDVAIVDLSIDARSVATDREAYLLRASLVNTLSGVGGVRWVDVLVAGRVETALKLPPGAGEASANTLYAQWTQAQAEDDMSVDVNSRVQRQALLYYPTKDGRFIVPVAQSITVAGQDALWALISAVSAGDTPDRALDPILPAANRNVITDAQIVTLPDGRQVARISFDSNLNAMLERSHFSPWQVYGALTCTFTGFLQELDGVQVYVGNGQLALLDSPEGPIVPEDGILTREMFERMIGCLRPIYMTVSDGQLRRLSRAMSLQDSLSPRRLLEPLFAEPEDWEADVYRTIPDGLSIDDLIGVRITGGEAVLNFSSAFYAGCQRLNEQQERNLVYALVNTLTDDGSVNSVRIQIEGETVPCLVRSISLTEPLLRNPGLIAGQANN